LSTQPDGAKLLSALIEPQPTEADIPPSRRREPEPESNPLTELLAKARHLTERVDRLSAQDERWAALSREGYTEEGLSQIAEFGVRQGIADPREAARALERAVGHAEPVVQSGRHMSFRGLDQAEERRSEAAFQALMDGDDETFLATAIPSVLAEIRGR
jgi:hypothetical protein